MIRTAIAALFTFIWAMTPARAENTYHFQFAPKSAEQAPKLSEPYQRSLFLGGAMGIPLVMGDFVTGGAHIEASMALKRNLYLDGFLGGLSGSPTLVGGVDADFRVIRFGLFDSKYDVDVLVLCGLSAPTIIHAGFRANLNGPDGLGFFLSGRAGFSFVYATAGLSYRLE